jgi:uncharacterized cupin superfamily protein
MSEETEENGVGPGGEGYLLSSIDQIDDRAPDFGLDEFHEARFGTETLGLTQAGFAHMRVKPGQRQPFGHHHDQAQETYFILDGSGRVKVDAEILDLKKGDILRVDPHVIRAFEADEDGLEYLVFGQHFEKDGGLDKGWWTD